MKKTFIKLLVTSFLLSYTYSCANRGIGPQGGLKDETPPKVTNSTPARDSKNISKKNIEIVFDEYIILEKPHENVVISPPQEKAPNIKSFGKNILIDLNDELNPNTTYTIDFGNSIMDNNEKNVLENFSLSFSTGDQIDTLSIKGKLLDAETLNPIEGSFVGIHRNLSDTAFVSLPMERISKTNKKGEFEIKNIQEGKYHVFALNDLNRNYFFDQQEESIAFKDSIISPFYNNQQSSDTTKTDDTRELVLLSFKEDYKKQYFIKGERKEKEKFQLIFNAEVNEKFRLNGINFNFENQHLVQKNNTKDTIFYWLTNKEIIEKDTIHLEVVYEKTDSAGLFFMQKDTIKLTTIAKKNKKEKNSLDYSHNIKTGTLEFYDYPTFYFDTPTKEINQQKINLLKKATDTTWTEIQYKLNKKDEVGLIYEFECEFEAGENYQIKLDSAAIFDIYEKPTIENTLKFKVRPIEEYSNLILKIKPFNENIVLLLIDNNEKVIAEERANTEDVFFDYIKPGEYFLKMYIDENNNGKWDTGNFKEKKQPEKIYYLNKKINLRANWDIEEEWDYTSVPILKQKPIELQKK